MTETTPGAAPVFASKPRDVSSLIGVGGAGSRVLLAFFMVANAVFTVSTLSAVADPVPSVIGMVIVNAAAVFLVLPRRDPLPLWWTLAIVAGVAASTALISWQLAAEGPIGREAWFYGANTWLLFFTALRGRIGFAWFGFVAMTAITAAWALDVGRGPLAAVGLVQTHAGILLVGTLFTVALQRTSRRINDLNRRSVELAAASATVEAEQDIRQQRLEELSEVAVPLLARISRATSITDDDRIEYLLAEATLRDSVRARSLHLPDIVRATADARRRGVEVTLLDDRGGGLPTHHAMMKVTSRITQVLGDLDRGRLTIRLAPPGREAAASIVVERQGESRRLDLDENGEPLTASRA